ncbi:MAG: S66 peptidase family protein [Fimbriimonas sp.]
MPLPRILPGATLGIVSPSSPIPPEDLEKGLAVLDEMGFRTRLMPNALARNGHLAGTDAERVGDLHDAFADPGIDAVLCARGGYGVARLLPMLDLDALAETGKPFLGFSDITALHVALNRRGLPTLHSPMVGSFAKPRPEWVRRSFLAALAGENPIDPEAPAGTTLVEGKARGVVAGGCLSLLADSLGSHEAFDGAGCLVLLEDIGEKPHRVDAKFTHLLNAGAIQNAAGFIVGEMTNSDALADPEDHPWLAIVRERLAPLKKPTIVGYPFGHLDAMLTLPLGVMATLDADAGTLSYALA